MAAGVMFGTTGIVSLGLGISLGLFLGMLAGKYIEK